MRQEKKQKYKPAVILVLSFCVIALVSIFAVTASINKVNDNMRTPDAANVVKEKAVSEKAKEKEDSAGVVDSRENKNTGDHNTASQFIVPLKGEIIMEHSVDMPIYWETLDQYMTHSGVDIAAPAGTDVKACGAGTVTRIEDDDRFGFIVEINHGSDLLSLYGNLMKKGLPELGSIVSAGDIIGQVGQSSRFEFESPEHLHFEMMLKNEPADPGKYVKGLK